MFNTRLTSGGGAYVCCFTKKNFEWVTTPDNSDQYRALRELQAHQQQVRAEREAAAGRKLNIHEMLHGIRHDDARSLRERVKESGQVRTNANPPDTSDWAARRAAELRAQWGSPSERRNNERRAKHYDQLAAEHARQAEAERERAEVEAKKAADPKYSEALFHAQSIIDELKFNGEAPQSVCEAADRRLAALLATADHRAYWETAMEYVRWRDERIDADLLKAADAAEKMKTNGIPENVASELAQKVEVV